MQYTLYVDESGDSGIRKIRSMDEPGASPYLTMGAVLVPDAAKPDLLNIADSFSEKIGRNNLHCSDLSHTQIVSYCEHVRSGRFQAFGVISRKETLGNYREAIEYNNKLYYHKCLQYLLETVGRACTQHEIDQDDLEVVIEEGVCELGPLRSYIDACRIRPFHRNAELLRRIDPNRISLGQKTAVPLLQYADLVAHALFKAVDKSRGNFGVVEPRYTNELRKKFYSDPESGQIIGWGIKAIHTLGDLKLDTAQDTFFKNLRSS